MEDSTLKILLGIFLIGIIICLIIKAFECDFNFDKVEQSNVHDTCIVYRNELYCRVELYEG